MRPLGPHSQPRQPALFTRRRFVATSLAASAALALYSNEISRHEIEVTHPTFYLPRLPPAFDGFRIAQISDIHLAEYTEDFFLRRVIARVNALAPDMVLLTGDYISRGPLSIEMSMLASSRCAQLLSTLTCPLRYAILGNHDAFLGPRVVREHMENYGIPVLVNRFLPVERGGQHIILAGVDTASEGRPNLTLAVPEKPDAPVILMAHEPDFADRVANHGRGANVTLILSGHSHGGQVRLPGLRPLALPPLGRLYPEGHYLVGASQLYVNRGIGTVGLPFRLNCPPEITLATLKPVVSS